MRFPAFYIVVTGVDADEENPQISRMAVDIHIYHYSANDFVGQRAMALVNSYLTILTEKFRSMKENITISFNGKVAGSTGSTAVDPDDPMLQSGVLHLDLIIHEVLS